MHERALMPELDAPSGGVVAQTVRAVIEQSSKAYSPMLVTCSGIVISVRSLQPLNALFPMLVIFLPMLTEANLAHCPKESLLPPV